MTLHMRALYAWKPERGQTLVAEPKHPLAVEGVGLPEGAIQPAVEDARAGGDWLTAALTANAEEHTRAAYGVMIAVTVVR